MSDMRMEVPNLSAMPDLMRNREMMDAEAAYQKSMRLTKIQMLRLQLVPVLLELVKANAINIAGKDNLELPTIRNFTAALDLLVKEVEKASTT